MQIHELLKDHQSGQDETQLQTFVLGGRTPWGRYKQALRELHKRVRGLKIATTERDLLLVDIDELEERPRPCDQYERRRHDIRLRQKRGELIEADHALNTVKREAATFFREALALKAVIGDVTPAKRVRLDREEWRHWHLKKTALHRMLPHLPEVVAKNLCALPEEERAEWISAIQSTRPEDFIGTGDYGQSAFPAPTEDEINQLETQLEGDD